MRHVALLLAAICLLAPLAGALPATGAVDHHGNGQPAVSTPFEDTRTTFTVSLRENGDARWTVAVAYRLEDDRSRDAFDAYADAYETEGSTTGPTVDMFRNAASAASDATGRDMTVRNVNRTAGFENETTGVLRLRFTWTNFLRSESEGVLVLDDVFRAAPEETWFRTLEPSQRLVIEPPPGYDATSVAVPRNRIVSQNIIVDQPATFASGDISVTYERSELWWEDSQVLVGSAGLLVLLVAAAYLVSRRRTDGADAAVTSLPPAGSSGAGVTRAGVDGEAGDEETETETGPSTVGSVGPADPEPNLDLLSDEERVERLLERNGGRMRQADIVSETGWSDAKVSQLLSAMAEDGDVEKLRLGRENLISLPDDDGTDGGDGGSGGDGDGDGDGSGSGRRFGL
ncbi:helix-turn-helix transcriptional regulator [Halorarum salinum]|uniref:Uncharacterized protein n=1 Tax=Halorarum salinum TaxID=2743089 RepID=A0A7D5LD37_9EURY|nr:hypothetical protein [Halobaculum salinum]QLG63547.1 hypothetical protein HUG12_18160 [Halobaculum salinum]